MPLCGFIRRPSRCKVWLILIHGKALSGEQNQKKGKEKELSFCEFITKSHAGKKTEKLYEIFASQSLWCKCNSATSIFDF